MGTDSNFPFLLKGGVKIPRRERRLYISSYYHIMIQGINKLNIFKTNIEKNTYLKYLNEEKKKYGIKILAYVIMDNHLHLLIYDEKEENVSKWMQIVNTKYAKFYNKEHNRVGYVYRDRFKSKPISDRTYLYNVLAYIHFNPIEAGISKELSQYSFSSYNDYLCNRKSKEEILLLFENEDYQSLYNLIHEKYYKKMLLKSSESPENILENYLHGKKVKEIKRDKELIAKIVIEMKRGCNLREYQIAKILSIGKNRINQLRREGFIKED